jgi:hypothetical protein
MKANSAARLFVLAAIVAGLTSLAPHVASAKERKPSEPNRVPLGLKLLTEHQRLLIFQDRLRGLCEVATAERVAAGQWRANCTDSSAFIIKVYRDGFMTVTRSSAAVAESDQATAASTKPAKAKKGMAATTKRAKGKKVAAKPAKGKKVAKAAKRKKVAKAAKRKKAPVASYPGSEFMKPPPKVSPIFPYTEPPKKK